jgi:hypothetical protein
MRNREPVYELLIDFAKAFDSVNRKKLLKKLKSRNFPDYLINILSHMLS